MGPGNPPNDQLTRSAQIVNHAHAHVYSRDANCNLAYSLVCTPYLTANNVLNMPLKFLLELVAIILSTANGKQMNKGKRDVHHHSDCELISLFHRNSFNIFEHFS